MDEAGKAMMNCLNVTVPLILLLDINQSSSFLLITWIPTIYRFQPPTFLYLMPHLQIL